MIGTMTEGELNRPAGVGTSPEIPETTPEEGFEDNARATSRGGGGYRLRWPRKPTHEQQHEQPGGEVWESGR